MKLQCEVETMYLLAQASGGAGCACKNSKSRASLSIGAKKRGRMDNGCDELFLTVSTAKNIPGINYKVKGNIVRVFSRFIKDGRVTLRFKDPSHDLSISKADPVKLKQFLALLNLSPQVPGDSATKPATPSFAQPTRKDLEKPQTKLVVKTRQDYPSACGFSPTLEAIEAVSINLNRIDKRMLTLSNLKLLDLSDNAISVIPEQLNTLGLVELKLAGNRISEFPIGLCCGNILSNTLRTLDISRNSLTCLPCQFHNFKNLVTLRVDCNRLQMMPRTFGRLSQLRYLFASSNSLVVLPHSFSSLNLDSLDLYNNPFQASGLLKRCSNLSLPTLVELSGRVIKKNRLHYSPNILPVVLCHYLDSAKKCLCGTACMGTYLLYVALLDARRISASVTAIDKNGSFSVPIELFLCSAKCLKLWKHYK